MDEILVLKKEIDTASSLFSRKVRNTSEKMLPTL